ncbi:MAG TPA: hypothetical protein VMI09_13535 [Candidatus Binataceae bacterium]|nr:hypothetical protein [Candidatus Binataceae bacterium]
MERVFSKAELRILSSIVALMLVLSGAPLTTGVVVVAGTSQPEFTLNICQPVQSFTCPSTIVFARSADYALPFVLLFSGSITFKPSARILERDLSPDTPPPKRFA